MIIYIIKKFFTLLLILFLISLISFSLSYFAPNSALSHLTIYDAYSQFWQQLFLGKLELHAQSSDSFLIFLKQILPATLELFILAIIFATLIGIPIGVFAGLVGNNKFNHCVKLVCLLLYACPIIWLAILMAIPFASDWSITIDTTEFPTSTSPTILDRILTPSTDKSNLLIDKLKELALPVLILAIQPCIITIQLVSEQIALVTKQNYIKVINIRENSSLKLLFKHIFPNALPTLIPQLTYNITTLLFSTMVIEIIFNHVGLGSWVFVAFFKENYDVIALTLLSCGVWVSLLILLGEILIIAIYPMRYRGRYE